MTAPSSISPVHLGYSWSPRWPEVLQSPRIPLSLLMGRQPRGLRRVQLSGHPSASFTTHPTLEPRPSPVCRRD